MLQQTTVATVRSRYEAFLSRFPTVEALAKAPEEDVVRAWEGLGYYRRARNLHAAARLLRETDRPIPRDPAELAKLPGLGRYSSCAIACFAWNDPHPILEANTKRLWARLTATEGETSRSAVLRQLWRAAGSMLPDDRAGDFNQALMDLGSTVCKPNEPACNRCPLAKWCDARRLGVVDRIPTPSAPKKTIEQRHVSVAVRSGSRVLVVRRPPEGPWSGMWEFPRVELADQETEQAGAERALREHRVADAGLIGAFATIRHAVMHFRVRLTGMEAVLAAKRPRSTDDRRWVTREELGSLPLSSPQRRLAKLLAEASASERPTRPEQPFEPV